MSLHKSPKKSAPPMLTRFEPLTKWRLKRLSLEKMAKHHVTLAARAGNTITHDFSPTTNNSNFSIETLNIRLTLPL